MNASKASGRSGLKAAEWKRIGVEYQIKDNLFQEPYAKDIDLYYRRGDGFATVVKHPTLSAEELRRKTVFQG